MLLLKLTENNFDIIYFEKFEMTVKIVRSETPSHIPNRPPKLQTNDMNVISAIWETMTTGKLLNASPTCNIFKCFR